MKLPLYGIGFEEDACGCSERADSLVTKRLTMADDSSCCSIVGRALYDSMDLSLEWPVTLLTLLFSKPAAFKSFTDVALMQCGV